MIAVCRLRYCQRTRTYAARRLADGKTKREIIRCLKRYITRELFHTLQADLADLTGFATTPLRRSSPKTALTITCDAGFTGRTHPRT